MKRSCTQAAVRKHDVIRKKYGIPEHHCLERKRSFRVAMGMTMLDE